MRQTIAFDVYGTLIDTSGVTSSLAESVGAENAARFSDLWRQKQLEYSFRRGLMQAYKDFSVCTGDALDYTCNVFQISLDTATRERLLAEYRVLPAYTDADSGLQALQSSGHHLYAFSNGLRDDVDNLLEHAAIRDFFIDIVSVDEVQSFKPHPAVYQHFLARTKASQETCWLVSSNPFDVLGALSAGMHTAWVRRSPNIPFDPWGPKPTVTIATLTELNAAIAASLEERQ